MKHNIQIQAWGHAPVVVCMHCGEGSTGKLLLERGPSSISFTDVVNAIEEHTGEGAFRATGPDAEEDLVAYGEPDEFPVGYHPRTGQKLPENLDPSVRPGGGNPLADYLHQKGEF